MCPRAFPECLNPDQEGHEEASISLKDTGLQEGTLVDSDGCMPDGSAI